MSEAGFDFGRLGELTRDETIDWYFDVHAEGEKIGQSREIQRALAQNDLFYLLTVVLKRKDIGDHDWIYARCREVQKEPNGYLDLWSREHFKSSIITYGLTIQDILRNPEITVAIISFNRPTAKAFLRQIKIEFEANEVLRALFPDILWPNPWRDAPKWALDSNTPVLTTLGWKLHGDLEPGDHIFGSQGQIITVTGNSGPTDDAECYRVVFDDCELVASADHLWPVQWRTNMGIPWHAAPLRIKCTKDLVRDKAHCRMLPTPVVEGGWVDGPLSVDPYILGLWLGDGTAGTNIISMHRDDEPEILAQVCSAGYEPYIHRRFKDDNFSMYGLRGLKEHIEMLGCLREKHIPQQYLLASADMRLALLQGLMDSDGTCKKDGRHRASGMCMFSNTNQELAEAVFYLATSLGMRPSTISFIPKPPGRKRVYHVYFVGIKTVPPFRLARKLEHCKERRVKTARYLRAVERTETRTVNCITVDAEDHLYLAGSSMVPTHNSEDDGIVVRRKGNPKESTVEAWGLVDGQPTGRHFALMVYDDVVTADSVGSPDMIEKVTRAWETSRNLTMEGGATRYIGTRWHYADTYRTIMERKAAIPRIHPVTYEGTVDGTPVIWTKERVAEKRREMGPYSFASQLLLDPSADRVQGFKEEWIRYYQGGSFVGMNNYLLVDPANSKNKSSDYTVMAVIGLADDQNYYLLDMIRDRLSLPERGDALFALHRRWRPKGVGYEQYGMQADIDYVKDRQNRENYRFEVTPVAGKVPKPERIRRLIPLFEDGRFHLPETLFKVDYEGKHVDLVRAFLDEEYRAFPVGLHDDMFDAMSRIWDLGTVWPKATSRLQVTDRYARGQHQNRPKSAWAA